MRAVKAVDNAIMTPVDALVLSAWNRWEIRRIWLVRIVVFATVVADCLPANAAPGLAAACLFVLGVEEFSARLAAKLHNAITAEGRSSAGWAIVRLSTFVTLACFALQSYAAGEALAVWRWVGAALLLALLWTFVPEDPPVRRRAGAFT